ncbi:unnamed protein product [Urochloa humidicola]
MAIATYSRDSRDNEDKVRCCSVSSPSLLPSVRSGWGRHGKVRASRHAVGLVLRSPLPNPSMNEVQYPLPLPATAGCAFDHWRPSSSSSPVSTTTPPRMPYGPGELMVMSIHTLRIGHIKRHWHMKMQLSCCNILKFCFVGAFEMAGLLREQQ